MSTGYLPSAGVWVEAVDYQLPPNRVLRQPRPGDPQAPPPAAGLPDVITETDVRWAGQDYRGTPRNPTRQPPPDHFQSRTRPEMEDVNVVAAWRDQGDRRAPQLPSLLIRPAALTEPPQPPSLTSVDQLYAWQGDTPRRPSRPGPAAPSWEPPASLWSQITAGQGEPAVALFPIQWQGSRAPQQARAGAAAVFQDALPPYYSGEAAAALLGWRDQQPPGRRVTFRVTAPPADPPPAATIIDVTAWPLSPQPLPPGRQPPRPPQPDPVPGSLTFFASPPDAAQLAGLTTAAPGPVRLPGQLRPGPPMPDPIPAVQLALSVPWVATTESPPVPGLATRSGGSRPLPFWQPPGEQLWSVLWVVAGPYRADAISVYTAGAAEGMVL